MADSSDSRQIEYRAYVPSDADAMAKLLAEVFSRHDPPAVAAGLSASEFEVFVRLLCPRWLPTGWQSWRGWLDPVS